MDEAEKYQQRLQAIEEKRRMQEEEEKVKRGVDEECLKLAQQQRKTLREQWLMDRPAVTPSSPEDPKLQSTIPAFYTTEQSAEETQSLERKMKKVEQSKNRHEEPLQIRKNTSSILAADNKEKAYLEEEERDVIKVLDVELKINLVSSAAQDTEEKSKATTKKQEVVQLTVAASNQTSLSLEDDEEWEVVNCTPEEAMDLLAQDQSDLCLDNKHDRTVLEVEHIFIMDEEEDLEVSPSEVLSLVVAKRKSDLEEASCEKPYEGALQTLSLKKGAHVQELGYVPGTISEEPSVFSVDRTSAQKEILGDNTKKQDRRSISASTNVKAERKEASGLEDEARDQVPRIPLIRRHGGVARQPRCVAPADVPD
ncbi:Paralemmin-3 [Bagarius yarrelli]|uniref:Paralemmin-3 n=1 Tax=Bagarius yarrelli TaxID=175774 RepID=A0A556TVT2_BAGYA|nr:Paralemmin-3 [Bagarius yarrelli]